MLFDMSTVKSSWYGTTVYLDMYPGTMLIMPAAQSPAPTLCSSLVSR